MIQVNQVDKFYGNHQVLNKIDFQAEQGQQIVIGGASGSGKSTLLYLLGGLDRPSQGEIQVGDFNLTEFDDESMAAYRNQQVGFVFQFHFLLPSMTCEENALLPAQIGQKNISKVRKQVRELADYLGVASELKKYPFHLSGGQQQRINIVRALSLSPSLLLCDEPTGNLDTDNSALVMDLLLDMAGKSGATLIVVTHDPIVTKRFSGQYEMIDGKLEQRPPAFS